MTTSIDNRFVELLKLNKNGANSLTYICKVNQYNYIKTSNKIRLIHYILQQEFTVDYYNNFINYIEVDEIRYKNRFDYLNSQKTNVLKNILKSYNLTQNGSKYYLVDRILKYEFYRRITTLDNQTHLLNYKTQNNLLCIPQINFINDNYDNYDIDLIYKPYEFYNICEYVKHLNNLRYLNKYILINEHLSILSQNWLQLVQFSLIESGWNFTSINYDDVVMEAVNNKYTDNLDNQTSINNIPSYNYIENKCDNCIVCMDTIKKNDNCKKLSCGHIFHSDCIDNWLLKVLECPICRKSV